MPANINLNNVKKISTPDTGIAQITCNNLYIWKSKFIRKLITPKKTYDVLVSGVVKSKEDMWNDFGTNAKLVIPYKDPGNNVTYDLPFVFGTKQTFQKEDSSTFTGIGLLSEYGLPTNALRFDTSGSYNRWSQSNLRVWLNGTLANCLPEDFTEAVVSVKNSTKVNKIFTYYNDLNPYDTTYDKFFPLSLSQFNCKCTDLEYGLADESEGRYWEYWRNKQGGTGYWSGSEPYETGVTPNNSGLAPNNNRKIFKIDDHTSECKYWLRSAIISRYFERWNWYVYIDGYVSRCDHRYAFLKVAPACVI